MGAIAFRGAAIDAREIAAMLGVSPAYITGRITKRPDFPAPCINVSRRIRYWNRGDVLEWINGRTARRRAT